MLVNFLLDKCKMKEPIRRLDMLKLFHKRYKTRFPEILRRAAKCMELSFGLELKEVKPNGLRGGRPGPVPPSQSFSSGI